MFYELRKFEFKVYSIVILLMKRLVSVSPLSLVTPTPTVPVTVVLLEFVGSTA
ncbi:Uncharacterised protein [Staphylococcus aureus]|nr:Uncharacterised protein [Staphylococcus aureus]